MILRLHGGVHLCYYCTCSMYLIILLHYLMIFHSKFLVAVTVFIPQDSIVTFQNYHYIIVICYALSFLRMFFFFCCWLFITFQYIWRYLMVYVVILPSLVICGKFIHVSSPKFEEATNLPMSCHTCWSRWYSSVIPQCSFHSSGSIPCRPSPRG